MLVFVGCAHRYLSNWRHRCCVTVNAFKFLSLCVYFMSFNHVSPVCILFCSRRSAMQSKSCLPSLLLHCRCNAFKIHHTTPTFLHSPRRSQISRPEPIRSGRTRRLGRSELLRCTGTRHLSCRSDLRGSDGDPADPRPSPAGVGREGRLHRPTTTLIRTRGIRESA